MVSTQDSVGDAPADVRVLVVEDHPETLNLLQLLISRAGFIVTTAVSVCDALNHVNTERFDVLVSDIGLPDGTGYEVARAYMRTNDGLAIAFSGFGTADDVQRGKDAGFAHHLIKPRGVSELLALLASVRRV